MIPLFRLLLLCARSLGNSFPTTVRASQFVSHFAKCPCRWEDEARREELRVIFTDGADKCKPATETEREEVFVGEAEGVTVWRGKVCWSGRVVDVGSTHTLVPLIYSTYTPTDPWFFLRGRCSSCTVAHVLCLHLRCGWMEDRAKCFPLERQHCDKTSWLTGREIEQEKKKRWDFTVFKDAYSAVVSGEQRKQKEKKNTAYWYFQIWVGVWFLLLLAGHVLSFFFNPSLEICVLEEL